MSFYHPRWKVHIRLSRQFWSRSNACCHTMNKALKLSVYSKHNLIIDKSITSSDDCQWRKIYFENARLNYWQSCELWNKLLKRNGLSSLLKQSLLILHAKYRLSLFKLCFGLDSERHSWSKFDFHEKFMTKNYHLKTARNELRELKKIYIPFWNQNILEQIKIFSNNFSSGWTGKQRRSISLRQSPYFSFLVSHLYNNAIQLVGLFQGEFINSASECHK